MSREARHKKISPALIRAEPGIPSVGSFRNRLGGMQNAYRLAGYEPARRNWMAEKGHPFLEIRRGLMEELMTALRDAGLISTPLKQRCGFELADSRWVSVESLKQGRQKSGAPRWWLRARKPPQPIARVMILMRGLDSRETILVLGKGQWKSYDSWISTKRLTRWSGQRADTVPQAALLLVARLRRLGRAPNAARFSNSRACCNADRTLYKSKIRLR